MGRTSLTVTRLDRIVSAMLESKREELSMAYRKLADESGISTTRLHALLQAERPITVGELEDMAEALGLIGWKVMKEAEESLNQVQPVASITDLAERLARVDLSKEAALNPGYSPDMEEGPDMP